MRLYVAGASAEILRAEAFIEAARALGYVVEHDWCAMVRSVGQANGPLAPGQREAAKRLAFLGASTCDVFVLLLPLTGTRSECNRCGSRSPNVTIGAWWELAVAEHVNVPGVDRRRDILIVGYEPERTVMTVGLEHIATDDLALAWLRGRLAAKAGAA